MKLKITVKKKRKFVKKIELQKNIVYFSFHNDECLYIGETSSTLKERCYTHTPKESKETWFKEGNNIYIIELGDTIDNIARHTIEQVLILSYRPKYNKK